MERFAALLRDTQRHVKLSVIITHDPELILRCCTHVLHLDNGRVCAFYPLDSTGAERVKSFFLAESEESSSKKRDKTSQVGRILRYAGSHRKSVYAAAFLMMLGAAESVVPYGLTAILANRILTGAQVTLQNALPLIGGVLLCEILYAVLYMQGLKVSHHAAFGTLEIIRCRLQEKLEAQPLGSITERSSGELKKLFTEDIESIEMLLAHMIPEGMANLFVPAAALILLIAADWQLAVLTVLMVLIGLSISKQMYKVGMDKMGSYFASAKRMNSEIVEYVGGMEVVRIFNRQNDSDAKFEKAVRDYRDFALSWYQVSWPWMSLYGSVFSQIVLYTLPFGGLLILLGQLDVTHYLLALILSFGIGPLLLHCMSFVGAIPQVSYKLQSLERALDTPPLKTGDAAFCGIDHSICFADVHFSYRDTEVIKGISFTVPQGTVTALIGHSGSGKSTIANLLARFWDVKSGEILLRGTDIRSIPLAALMSQISMVFQHVYLFQDTVYNNIAMGRQDAAPEAVYEAARKAQCYDFIMQMPYGFDMLIGEGGATLSGGEAQRISIARCILKDAPIIILDEATASIDADNERSIQQAMSALCSGTGKTTLVIAHRLYTIADADQILVLKDGRIAERGTAPELRALNGIYAGLEAANG